jgi:hypothetical protein
MRSRQDRFFIEGVQILKKLVITVCIALTGCSSLLPRSNTVVEGPWQNYQEAQQTFDRIVPYQTRSDDLKALGLDLDGPNIAILTYSDIVRRLIPSQSISPDDLDTGVRDCIKGKTACRGFEIDQKSIKRTRYGNFWADSLNFKRQVDVTGWRFNGMLLIKDNLVVYKLVGGQPVIRENEYSSNPLGPFQEFAGSALRNGL